MTNQRPQYNKDMNAKKRMLEKLHRLHQALENDNAYWEKITFYLVDACKKLNMDASVNNCTMLYDESVTYYQQVMGQQILAE